MIWQWNTWLKGPSAVSVTRGKSISSPSPLPHFSITSRASTLQVTCPLSSCEGSCSRNLLLVHFKSSWLKIYFILRYLWCANAASLRGNQWFLLQITPTQTLASCAIITLLKSFASHKRRKQRPAGANQLISHTEGCARPKVKWLHLFTDFRAICYQPPLCNKRKNEKH